MSFTPREVDDHSKICADAEAILHLTVRSTGDRLGLASVNVLCHPENSSQTPGSARSYGNPFRDFATWTVIGGTGVVADAAGSGSYELFSAGARFRMHLTGTPTLP